MIEDLNVYILIDFYDRPTTVYLHADCFLLVNIVVDNTHYHQLPIACAAYKMTSCRSR
jgi:hypothetical protein